MQSTSPEKPLLPESFPSHQLRSWNSHQYLQIKEQFQTNPLKSSNRNSTRHCPICFWDLAIAKKSFDFSVQDEEWYQY